jgi:hypothetical protein
MKLRQHLHSFLLVSSGRNSCPVRRSGHNAHHHRQLGRDAEPAHKSQYFEPRNPNICLRPCHEGGRTASDRSAGPVNDNGASIFFRRSVIHVTFVITLMVIMWPRSFELGAGDAITFVIEVVPIPVIHLVCNSSKSCVRLTAQRHNQYARNPPHIHRSWPFCRCSPKEPSSYGTTP